MTRRVVVCILLFVALAVSGVGWAESRPETRAVNSAVTLTRPPGLAVDATVKGRSDTLTAGWAEQRLPKARVRLGLAVLVGLSLLLAAALATLTRPSPGPNCTRWRRWSVALRAPPLLRLS
jgi:hypothetical protein